MGLGFCFLTVESSLRKSAAISVLPESPPKDEVYALKISVLPVPTHVLCRQLLAHGGVRLNPALEPLPTIVLYVGNWSGAPS